RFTGAKSAISQNDFCQSSTTFRFSLALILHGDLTSDSDCHSRRIAIKGRTRVNQSVRTYTVQRRHSSGTSSGTYVRIESPENTDILFFTNTSIPRNPRTRRPAALVTLLQYSRL